MGLDGRNDKSPEKRDLKSANVLNRSIHTVVVMCDLRLESELNYPSPTDA